MQWKINFTQHNGNILNQQLMGLHISTTRRRVIWFLAGISAFTALVQWDGAAGLIDAATGGIKWSGAILAFFKSNTQGLIELIILGIYFEFIGISKSKDLERKESNIARELLEYAVATSSVSALLRHGLKERFGIEAADQILRNALKPCSILHNVVVKIIPKNCIDGYDVTLKLSYTQEDDRFFVAVTDNSFQCEALLATGVLNEVFMASVADVSLVPAKVKKWVKAPNTESLVSHELKFTALPIKEKKELFKNTALLKHVEKLRIFEGRAPDLMNISSGSVTFEMESYHRQKFDYPFMFWLSDRVLEVQSMEVDLGALTRQQQHGSRIHLFMSSIQGSNDVNPDSAVWNYPHKTWLLPGQGLAVIWPPISTSTQEKN